MGKLRTAYDWLEANLGDGPWAAGDSFTLADCAAAPSLFYADWVERIGPARPRLAAYRARLLAHPIVARAVDEARPYRHFFPAGRPRPRLIDGPCDIVTYVDCQGVAHVRQSFLPFSS